MQHSDRKLNMPGGAWLEPSVAPLPPTHFPLSPPSTIGIHDLHLAGPHAVR